jgi:hypothetical protein
MALWSGNSGEIVVDPAGAALTLNVTKWTVRKTARLAEATHSGKAATNFEKVVPHYEWTAEVPWDDENLPDTDGTLIEGAKVTIRFVLGASTKLIVLTDTSVETLEQVDDNENDIIRAVVSGKGGSLTRETT